MPHRKDSDFPMNRRDVLKAAGLGLLPAIAPVRGAALPSEPLEIGSDPQFVLDNYAIESTWALVEKQAPVKRVAHAPRKHPSNPFWTDDGPSHLWALRGDDGDFRIWYQLNEKIKYPQGRKKGQAQFRTHMGYAQSKDGLHWERPALDLFKNQPGGAELPRNVVLHRPGPATKAFDCPQIVEAPPGDRRGYRYLMVYLGGGGPDARGIRLIGSKDGIHWDMGSDIQLTPIPSDHHNTVIYDPKRGEYVMFLRAKDRYLASHQRGGGDTIEKGNATEILNTGQSRRNVARMTSKQLWIPWSRSPQTVFAPDELDAASNYNFVYGMPVRYFAGIYWGFVQVFRMNDYMHIELAWSRDGIAFERLPTRPRLIDYGPAGSWDDTMLLACPNWIEAGDEWWVYYNGWNGPHETADRVGGIGLARYRKEGFVSLRGPDAGGVGCTRLMRWPGGDLKINADASKGELRVRVSDEMRRPLAGFDYDKCQPLRADRLSHAVTWHDQSLDGLKGRPIRLEFYLKNADLFTFRAAPRA